MMQRYMIAEAYANVGLLGNQVCLPQMPTHWQISEKGWGLTVAMWQTVCGMWQQHLLQQSC